MVCLAANQHVACWIKLQKQAVAVVWRPAMVTADPGKGIAGVPRDFSDKRKLWVWYTKIT